MIIGLHHTGLTVPDVDAAADFYCRVGGYEECLRFELPDNSLHRQALGAAHAAAKICWLKNATGYLELMEFEQPTGSETAPAIHDNGIRHICLQDVDADPFYDAFLASGGSGHARPVGLGTGNQYVYVRDPFKNWVELEGLPYAPRTLGKPWFAHAAIVTHDFDRLLSFYETLLETPRSNDGSFGPAEAYDIVSGLQDTRLRGGWVPANNGTVEIWQYLSPARSESAPAQVSDTGFTHICFEVDDVASHRDKLAAAGVRFLSEPVDNGLVTAVYGKDPDGNLFELMAFEDTGHRFSLRNAEAAGFLDALAQATAAHYQARAAEVGE